jgi:hypothetical protein
LFIARQQAILTTTSAPVQAVVSSNIDAMLPSPTMSTTGGAGGDGRKRLHSTDDKDVIDSVRDDVE